MRWTGGGLGRPEIRRGVSPEPLVDENGFSRLNQAWRRGGGGEDEGRVKMLGPLILVYRDNISFRETGLGMAGTCHRMNPGDRLPINWRFLLVIRQ
jgi:hypothetical protein